MKSLLKIIRRYSLMVGLIIFIILFCNAGVLVGITYMAGRGIEAQDYGRKSMELTGKRTPARKGRRCDLGKRDGNP